MAVSSSSSHLFALKRRPQRREHNNTSHSLHTLLAVVGEFLVLPSHVKSAETAPYRTARDTHKARNATMMHTTDLGYPAISNHFYFCQTISTRHSLKTYLSVCLSIYLSLVGGSSANTALKDPKRSKRNDHIVLSARTNHKHIQK